MQASSLLLVVSRAIRVVIAVLVCAAPAAAATVAVIRPVQRSAEVVEALYRLQGELLAVGLEVVMAERPRGEHPTSAVGDTWIETLALERGVDAVIEVVGGSATIAADVWIVQRSPPGVRLSRVVLAPDTQNVPETLAIRAIDVLRSNFLVLDLAGNEPTRARKPPRVSQRRTKPVGESPGFDERFRVEAGATIMTSLDGIGPAIAPVVGMEWPFAREFAVVGTLAGFGTRATLENGAGGVRVSHQYAVLGACLCGSSRSRFRPVFSLGVGALRTALDGFADAPNRGQDVSRWSVLFDGSAGTRLQISDRYYVALGAHVQLAEPYVAVFFVDEHVATAGRPNLSLSLTLGAGL